MAAAIPNFTIVDGLALCGVSDAPLFQGESPQERISMEFFEDN